MDENQINKAIYYGIALIIVYNIIGVFMPILTWGVFGLIAYRIFLEYQKHRK